MVQNLPTFLDCSEVWQALCRASTGILSHFRVTWAIRSSSPHPCPFFLHFLVPCPKEKQREPALQWGTYSPLQPNWLLAKAVVSWRPKPLFLKWWGHLVPSHAFLQSQHHKKSSLVTWKQIPKGHTLEILIIFFMWHRLGFWCHLTLVLSRICCPYYRNDRLLIFLQRTGFTTEGNHLMKIYSLFG